MSHRIDLSIVRDVLGEVSTLVESLDGEALDETAAVESQAKTRTRQERARLSQNLQYVAAQLDLAAALVRNEYWVARGKPDHLKES